MLLTRIDNIQKIYPTENEKTIIINLTIYLSKLKYPLNFIKKNYLR